MSDYPMLISNKLHSFRNFILQVYGSFLFQADGFQTYFRGKTIN